MIDFASFDAAMNQFRIHVVKELSPLVFAASATALFNSVVFGSPTTGSPGQPVADVQGGNLRASFSIEFPSPMAAIIGTNSAYAEPNEDGIARPGGGAYRLLASIGGRHSIALSVAGWNRLVDEETAGLAEP